MPEILYLSHWDAAMPVVIPVNIVQDLANYHILGIRFLYNCLQKGYRGAILNEESNMNPHIQVCAFLNALNSSITIESPAIILCTSQTFGAWHYYLSKYAGNAITILSEQSCEEILQGKSLEIILSTVEDLKWLKGAELDFFTVIIDDLDVVINKKFVKQIKGQYHIGITSRNFLRNPAQKLFRSMLLWANPGSVGKLEEFCQEDNDHLKYNRNAYAEHWLRLTWSFCDSFKKPTDDELQSIEVAINEWTYENLLCNPTTATSKKPVRRKRKRESVDTGQPDAKVPSLLRPKEDGVKSVDTKQTDAKRKVPSSLRPNEDGVKSVDTKQSDAKVKVTSPLRPNEDSVPVQAFVNSQETIIYDYSDDYTLLTSIMDNDSKPEHIPDKVEAHSSYFKESKTENNDDILFSIMNDDFEVKSNCGNVNSSHKNDVLSMLFSDSE